MSVAIKINARGISGILYFNISPAPYAFLIIYIIIINIYTYILN